MHRVRSFTSARALPSILIALAGSTNALAVPPLPFPPAIELSSLNGADGFVINGIDSSDFSGTSVASAGDVNGDGIDDLIIGAPFASPEGRNAAGETYVVFGGPAVGAGGSIELSSLTGTNGFVVNGIDADDRSGRSVASAGDVNGDGIDDLIIGASAAVPNGQASAGETYIVFGRSTGFAASLNLSTLDGTNGFVVDGIDTNDGSGASVSSAGDVNGDGIDDLIVGAPNADPGGRSNAGESYVVFGAPSLGATGTLALSSLNGSNGFVVNGINVDDASGVAVSSAGDVNADGYDDLIIGASLADPSGQPSAGENYVVFGSVGIGSGGSLELSALNGTSGFVINGIDANDRSGISVSSAGDVNGDGIDDLIIGAYGADPGGLSNAGESYVVCGGTGIGASGAIELSSLYGSHGVVLNGIDAQDFSGWSVSSSGDVNNDGIGDLIIGALFADPGGRSWAGESYVIFGNVGFGASGSIELSSLNGANGFVMNGIDANDFSGASVASAGDVNGDGIDDVIIGATNGDPLGIVNAGESYIVFGRAPLVCVGDVTGDGITNSADFNILASFFGQAVTPNTSGDLTGDGLVNSADFNVLAGDFGCGAP